MSEDLICPDCGGLIGGEPGQGRQVCKCFEPRRTATVTAAPPEMPPEPVADLSTSTVPSGVGEKLCRVCGRDLKGHRRLKDSRGYICLSCDAEERRVVEVTESQDLNLIPCPECGRKLKSEGFTTYQGNVMCRSCEKDAKELHKYKGPPPALVTHHEYEKQSLQKLLIIAGVLVVLMAAAYFGVIGR